MSMGLVVVVVGIASVSVYRTKVDTQAGPLDQTR